ncbi:butyrophilin subfamily 2 member A2-like isoform X2 [Erinaceus europaeus]|uniref:Butyrophilin subfamily 2 member A2-like isoform X2 n=1 Tax=Erinaceus europaeus TaxID=9365 RepID=A0ABM3XX83_ERIEU|nr:butyrophilin subfamily 2 member A2-like isoform X2 [Erinaceus europaeus]
MHPWYVGISTLLFSALLPWPGAGKFRVQGPGAPVIAPVGKEAVLPCHLSPVTDAGGMVVTWSRVDPPALVHHYAASQDHLKNQSAEYQGRTEFLKENITTGQVALRIRPILPPDNGEYRCNFASSTFEDKAQFTVLVTASGTAPQIHIEPGGISGVKLTCTSRGWYPEPEVHWRDLQGQQRLTAASETKTAARDGLFHVETSVTTDANSLDVSCVIRNPVRREEKEAHVSIAVALSLKIWFWMVVFAVLLCLLVSGTIFCVLFVQTKRKLGSVSRDHGNLTKEIEQLSEDCGHLKEENEKLNEDNCRLKKENGIFNEDISSLSRELAQSKALGQEGLNVIHKFVADIILDEDTAHPYLKVSENRKSVKSLMEKQTVPYSPKRFDTHMAVLGVNSFSAGDHYWEVEVVGKDRWTIGLCVSSVNRKGDIFVSPENGFWALSLENDEYKALSTPHSILIVPNRPQTVGIFLQFKKGIISFYNVTDYSLLYTFKSTFTKPLKPYFYPGPFTQGNTRDLHLPRCQ